MKKIIVTLLSISIIASCKKEINYNSPAQLRDGQNNINQHFSKKDTLQHLLDEYVQFGIPGLAVAVFSPEGYWAGVSGYSDVEGKIPMEISDLQYLQSISKTYMAAAILTLSEEGKINLDSPLTAYPPLHYSQYIENASTVTIRNLLNHTSGVPDYLDNLDYRINALTHPGHIFTSEEFLEYIKNIDLRFSPGSKFEYSNTNYHILALVADAVAGNHDELIKKRILQPLGLIQTYYRVIPSTPTPIKNYVDLDGIGQLQDVTELQHSSIISAKGDDGIICSPFDAIHFLRGLMQARILSAASLNQMITWINDVDDNPIYGMGLYHVTYSGVVGYGHGGAGVGAGCGLYYFPSKNIYVFVGTNIGTLADGPLVRQVGELKSKIIDILLTN